MFFFLMYCQCFKCPCVSVLSIFLMCLSSFSLLSCVVDYFFCVVSVCSCFTVFESYVIAITCGCLSVFYVLCHSVVYSLQLCPVSLLCCVHCSHCQCSCLMSLRPVSWLSYVCHVVSYHSCHCYCCDVLTFIPSHCLLS